jgi:acyl-ACP thioesterase
MVTDHPGHDGDHGAGPGDDAQGITVAYRVRFDEAGPDDMARASSILRYAQDCAWVHSERLGFGRDWYFERGLSWVVRSIELVMLGGVATGERLDVSTAVVGFRRVWARRRTLARDAGGALVSTIETDWVMTDLRRGSPTRVPPDFPRAFGAPPGSFEPHRVPLPPTPPDATATTFTVRPQELDPLGHTNNAAYLDWLEESALTLPDGRAILTARPRTYRLEYVAPAVSGPSITGLVWRNGPGDVDYRLVRDGTDLFRGTLEAAAQAET